MEKKEEATAKAKELRRRGRSVKSIAKELGVSSASVSVWVRGIELTEEQKIQLKETPRKRGKTTRAKDRDDNESRHHKVVANQFLTRDRKARIAEAAVLFRLALHGLIAYGSPFDGDKTDWLVENQAGKLLKVQVRWTKANKQGLPNIPLHCSDGRNHQRRYNDAEFDFMVGYDLFTDTAYVLGREEIKKYKAAVSIKPEYAEKWDKLLL